MTAEEYHDYEEDDGERIITTLTIEVSHPERWSVDTIASELFQWGEATNSDLSVHAVYEQPEESYLDHPPMDFHDMEDLEELEQCRALSDLEDLRYEENSE